MPGYAPEQRAHQRPSQGRAGIYILDKDIGRIPRHHIAQDTAAHARKHRQVDAGVRLGGIGVADPDHREDAQANRIHCQYGALVGIVVARQVIAHGLDEHNYRHQRGREGVDGVLKGIGRDHAQQQIADDTAAHGCG